MMTTQVLPAVSNDAKRALRGWRALCLLALLSLMWGCAATARVTTPTGFVELEDGFGASEATYKAVSPDGAVILVRRQPDVPAGSLQFWSEAMSRELVDGRGYELLATEDVRTDGGHPGKLLRLRGTLDERVYRYEVALFVLEEDVVTVEASAPDEVYESHAEAFARAYASAAFE